MNDLYLRSLGFAPTDPAQGASRPPFSDAWRYQHDQLAQDGASLFIEHPFGVGRCRLSALVAPLDAHDVFADMPLDDRQALETAMAAFYAAHGGVGATAEVFEPHQYLPYRRQR
ncbi:hypothetical protein [Hymenobacter sp. APR13]|uniref:hypothetical protein n=1 Tax=Hymenobacter sp. APR13 TaxID=1356852 RepID=UPI0004E07282|nr:hypothetical protein [Hymenobacter sp. APR13]AII53387.1 hypothetical protein N008_15545 [Hymenobacter sp. APR13]